MTTRSQTLSHLGCRCDVLLGFLSFIYFSFFLKIGIERATANNRWTKLHDPDRDATRSISLLTEQRSRQMRPTEKKHARRGATNTDRSLKAMTMTDVCSVSLFSTFLLLALFTANVQAYIPASPSNDSATEVNFTATAILKLAWYNAMYSKNVSYQLVGADSTGFNQVCCALL